MFPFYAGCSITQFSFQLIKPRVTLSDLDIERNDVALLNKVNKKTGMIIYERT
jgi:hypothetical protein